MFIEFETSSGATLLNVRHIMQVKRSHGRTDITEIIFANGGSVDVFGTYQEVWIALSASSRTIWNMAAGDVPLPGPGRFMSARPKNRASSQRD
jgi:hypothetical protein